MFALVWGPRSDDSDLHGRERDGVEYVSALNKLLPALVSAQSNAVLGKPATKDTFSEAVAAVGAADEKFGSDFGTTNRWSGLRARIETLPEQGGEGLSAFKSYGEATDLLLALYQRVGQASGLRSDSDAVITYLQDAALEEVPAMVVWAGRYQDQTVLAADLPAPDRDAPIGNYNAQVEELNTALTDLAVSRQVVSESGTDVASDMAAAVDASDSGTFSTQLLQSLDAFQRGVEAMAPPGQTSLGALPSEKSVTAQRAAAQSAATDLNPLLLDELGSQVEDRQSSADTTRFLAAALVVIAVVVTVLSILFVLISGRRSRSEMTDTPPYDPGNLDYSAYPAAPDPMGADPYLNNLDAGRDARRERAGVPR
ncbi:hypothetical protein [Cryptosporangium aurantiacum]|uniref:hypothetical protein n=1 Tax=Cryptosporangium aurantiacum TaxID=134849 RepID=UPI000934AB1B|nr:hypothetical protein [Cryptosporangium aurantiacum]